MWGDDGTILCALRVMVLTQLIELYPIKKQSFLCINFNFFFFYGMRDLSSLTRD